MNAFNFKIPQNIIFGMGSLNQLPALLAESGSGHVFLISDGGLAKLGVVEKIEGIIKAAGIFHSPGRTGLLEFAGRGEVHKQFFLFRL